MASKGYLYKVLFTKREIATQNRFQSSLHLYLMVHKNVHKRYFTHFWNTNLVIITLESSLSNITVLVLSVCTSIVVQVSECISLIKKNRPYKIWLWCKVDTYSDNHLVFRLPQHRIKKRKRKEQQVMLGICFR